MKILVNKNHIKMGKPNSTASCPIALALKGAGCTGVYVDGDSYEFNKNGQHKRGDLPSIAKRFVRNFDDGKKVNQMMFILK